MGANNSSTIVGNNSSEIYQLPEDCLSHVISFTSARDACRCSVVSTFFRSAADVDAVWQKFLPPGLNDILSQAIDRPVFATKKDLYCHLINRYILIHDGRLSFSLDKSSGAKTYLQSALATVICHGNNPQYWQPMLHSASRFRKVMYLKVVWWFDIAGGLSTKHLTSNTNYAAYFIFRLEDDAYGLDTPIETFLDYRGEQTRQIVILQRGTNATRQNLDDAIRYPQERDDDWSEIEMGEFYTDGEEDDNVGLRLLEVRDLWAKRGLIFNGFEFRPKIQTVNE